jgi:hypothetical protein
MGDRSPVELLGHRTIIGPLVHSDFLSNFWTIRMPPKIQSIIATYKHAALDDVAAWWIN